VTCQEREQAMDQTSKLGIRSVHEHFGPGNGKRNLGCRPSR
jgi:hypothetical protein